MSVSDSCADFPLPSVSTSHSSVSPVNSPHPESNLNHLNNVSAHSPILGSRLANSPGLAVTPPLNSLSNYHTRSGHPLPRSGLGSPDSSGPTDFSSRALQRARSAFYTADGPPDQHPGSNCSSVDEDLNYRNSPVRFSADDSLISLFSGSPPLGNALDEKSLKNLQRTVEHGSRFEMDSTSQNRGADGQVGAVSDLSSNQVEPDFSVSAANSDPYSFSCSRSSAGGVPSGSPSAVPREAQVITPLLSSTFSQTCSASSISPLDSSSASVSASPLPARTVGGSRLGSSKRSKRYIEDYFGSQPNSGFNVSPPPPGPLSDLSQGLNPRSYQRYKKIPTPRVVSLNLDGVSAGHTATARRKRVRKVLRGLARNADVLLLQETNTTLSDFRRLCLVPGFDEVVNPDRTAILIRNSFAESFQLTEFVVCEGHIHGVRFAPLADDSLFTSSFAVINVYLKAGSTSSDFAIRRSQLDSLVALKVDADFTVIGGDWNMVTAPGDTASGVHYASTPRDVGLLERALDRLRVSEVYQPSFTRFRDKAAPEGSRLDRIYVSHTPAHGAVMRPKMSVLPLPASRKHTRLSDHFPVRLSFIPNQLERNTRCKIPRWVVDHTDYLDAVAEEWSRTRKPPAPFKAWLAFKRVLKSEASKFISRRKHAPGADVEDLTIAVTYLRRTMAGADPTSLLQLYGSKSERVRQLVTADIAIGALGLPSLQRFISEQLGSRNSLDTPPQEDGDRSRARHPPFNFLKFAKQTLPSSRNHISVLRRSGGGAEGADGLLEDPRDIAEELRKCWEPVWGKKEVSPQAISDYLRGYPGRVRSPINEIDEDLALKVVLTASDTSAGPDGIPFRLYKNLAKTAAPLLLEVVRYLASTPTAKTNKSFNYSDLFFIPKKLEALLAKAMRPISVSNTDNRLIARMVKEVILGPLSEMLGMSQHAFLPHRSIEDPIRLVNDLFYSKYEAGEEFYLLLVDFAKAFDSVSQEFLFALLRHVGVPDWVCNIISNLYSNVRAKPILFGSHNVLINMLDGLKQGCPLAPLLFVMVMDPLLHYLSLVPDITPNAFADDLSLFSVAAGSFSLAVREVDRFTRVSGVTTNTDKTCLLSASGVAQPVIDALPARWQDIKFSRFERYLGTFVGQDVTVNNVFDLAWGKLTRRLSQYSAYKRFFSLQGRVDIANAFLSPLFSFLFRFYMMTETFMHDVERAIGKWVIPNSRFTFEHLTASPSQGGLQRPLRDLFRLNVAALLRSISIPVADQNNALDLASCRMATHRLVALKYYVHICEESPADFTPQRDLYAKLQDRDETPKMTLVAKIARRKGWDQENAAILTDRILSNASSVDFCLTPYIRHHLFEVIHNAVPTRRRMDFCNMDTSCRLCGQAEETMAHLTTECKVGSLAKQLILNSSFDKSDLVVLLTATPSDFSFERPLPTGELLSLLVFSSAVWYFVRPVLQDQARPPPQTAARSIAERFRDVRSRLLAKKPARRSRKDRDKRRNQLINSILKASSPCLVVATDGSCLSNSALDPGPAGAGFVLCEMADDKDPSLTLQRSVDLGKGTSYFAELSALDMALSVVLDSAAYDRVIFLIDNENTLRVAQFKTYPRSHADIGRNIQRKVRLLERRSQLRFEWVPGHAGYFLNDLADELAKRGASGVTSNLPLVPDDDSVGVSPSAPPSPDRAITPPRTALKPYGATRSILSPWDITPNFSLSALDVRNTPLRSLRSGASDPGLSLSSSSYCQIGGGSSPGTPAERLSCSDERDAPRGDAPLTRAGAAPHGLAITALSPRSRSKVSPSARAPGSLDAKITSASVASGPGSPLSLSHGLSPGPASSGLSPPTACDSSAASLPPTSVGPRPEGPGLPPPSLSSSSSSHSFFSSSSSYSSSSSFSSPPLLPRPRSGAPSALVESPPPALGVGGLRDTRMKPVGTSEEKPSEPPPAATAGNANQHHSSPDNVMPAHLQGDDCSTIQPRLDSAAPTHPPARVRRSARKRKPTRGLTDIDFSMSIPRKPRAKRPKAIAAADALRLASSSSKRRSRSSARSPDIRSSKRPKGPSADGHRFLSLAEWVNTRYPVPSSDSKDVDQHNPVEADRNQFHR